MRFAVRVLKNAMVFAAVVLVAAPVAAQGPPTPTKIGYVNARSLLQGMTGYAQAESAYVKERDAAQTELDRLRTAFDSAVAEFDQQRTLLSASNRAVKQKELETQRQKVESRAEELSDKISRRERELLEPMQQRLTAIIDGIRAEGNFAIIFDIGALGPALVSVDKSLDITDRVMQRLKQSN